MGQYLVLIYGDEAGYANADPGFGDELHAQHTKFFENNQAAIRGGAELTDSASATAIRGDGSGGFTVTDGTFAETKEVLGGYYVIEADDLDAALAIAKQVPAPMGGLEVRPLKD